MKAKIWIEYEVTILGDRTLKNAVTSLTQGGKRIGVGYSLVPTGRTDRTVKYQNLRELAKAFSPQSK